VKVHKNYRVISTAGLRYADVIIPLNDFIEVGDIKGYTELPNGKKIHLTKQDIGLSSAPGFRGLGGIQVVTFSLPGPTLGARLFYEYKLVIKSLLYLPRLMPRTDCPTNRVVVLLNWESKIKPRFDSEGFNFAPNDSLETLGRQFKKRDLKFFADNLPEIVAEPNSCPERFHILLSTDNFSYGKAGFSSISWQEIGYFFAKLSVQPQNKIDELKPLTQKLCVGSITRSDSLRAFFNFVADSVSYVALQVSKGDFTPHRCDVILSRRFGDCKDQSILLSSLCRAAGIEAYPALIATGDMPEVSSLFPWPSWFDHVVTVVRTPSDDIILDPSDKFSGINAIPPRLRGKSYLVCDGVSGLKTVPNGPDPAVAISWEFHVTGMVSDVLSVDFNVNFANDAAAAYNEIWQDGKNEQAVSLIQSQLKFAGWDISSFSIGERIKKDDSLLIGGHFMVSGNDVGDAWNLSVPSPLSTYLLQNLFPDVRITDFCNKNSYRLEESVIVDNIFPGLMVGSEYSDSWRRQGLEFTDEMTIDSNSSIYHRRFDYSGDLLPAVDYNAFRDFLLSRKDQQYVRIHK